MRFILIIIGVTLHGSVNSYTEDEIYQANKWVHETINGNINERFGDESSQGQYTCTFSNKQNGTCVQKELCSNVDQASQFILRDRDSSCSASEICCLKIKDDASKNSTNNVASQNPTNNVASRNPTDRMKCTTDRQEPGICVQMSLCSSAVQTIDPASRFKLRERGTCHYLEACCLESNVILNTRKDFTPNAPDGCGWSNPGANIFRTKDSDSGLADYGDFPWMIALIKKGMETNGWNESYAGGAALIHPSVVITAAHKVSSLKPNEIKVRAGEWDTRTTAEVYPYQEIDVTKIIIHDKYYSLHAHNDVALLILKSPVDLTEAPHIGVACLAPQLPPPGTRCFAMGWGKDFLNDNDNINAVVLKKLQLPLVQASVCEKQYQGTILGSGYRLDKSLTCAGGEKGVDTCDGDGGSPLVCPVAGQPTRYAVVGMVAYGLGCGIEHLPGVYVNVPDAYDWVGLQLTSEQFNKSSFVY